MDKLKIPQTPEERQAIIGMMQSLKQNEGWQYLLKILNYNISRVEENILSGEEMSIEEINRWKDKRIYQIELRDYPDKLIKQMSDDKPQEDFMDPYDNPIA